MREKLDDSRVCGELPPADQMYDDKFKEDKKKLECDWEIKVYFDKRFNENRKTFKISMQSRFNSGSPLCFSKSNLYDKQKCKVIVMALKDCGIFRENDLHLLEEVIDFYIRAGKVIKEKDSDM